MRWHRRLGPAHHTVDVAELTELSAIGGGPQPSEVLRDPAERAEAIGKLRRFVLTPVA